MAKQLIDFLFSPYRRQVLSVLFLSPGERFHVRQLERLTGISAGSLHRELKAMAVAGLLKRETQGNQVLYQVAQDCTIYEELASIFRKTVGMAHVLGDSLTNLAGQIDIAFVFGSMASGTQHKDSDLDLCVLGDVALFDVVKALGPAQDSLRREINPVVMRTSKFLDQLRAQDRFAERLRREPKVFVVGGEREFRELTQDCAT
ncbi:MAG: nucleotidyltransferase domain-containing protein [Halieaceae bacterium]|jgi:predicted nucleotidyltransferase/DNA-binding HxlR family transcriptional regulator|nr:nucleotidyltransferase domain-containing protein [Halieaceae bacterium]